MNRPTSPAVKNAVRAGPQTCYLGLDGCRGGWAVARIESHKDSVHLSIARTLESLRVNLLCSPRAFIDIPIGLKNGGAAERDCDSEARKVMASRKSSVFRVPVRSAVYAASYREALSLQRRQTGYGISIQAWNIAAKIRETDLFLRRDKKKPGNIFESHPELCFAALKGRPLSHSKKTAAGSSERIRILAQWLPEVKKRMAEALALHPRSVVLLDDILDACVLALSARRSVENGLRILPPHAPLDRCGLPMRIVYPEGALR